MTTPSQTVIAIDGTSGSGKSTLARNLARHFHFIHVDTGAMYRTLAWQCLREQQDCNDAAGVVRVMSRMRADFFEREGSIAMTVDGRDPGDAIRSEEVNKSVSLIARIPQVREWMVQEQRGLLRFGSLVMEGRDIGSVVFSDTPFKLYMDAHPEERADRRARDGISDQLTHRDKLDKTRKVSPLVAMPDAFVVDTSRNTPAQTMALALAELKRRGL